MPKIVCERGGGKSSVLGPSAREVQAFEAKNERPTSDRCSPRSLVDVAQERKPPTNQRVKLNKTELYRLLTDAEARDDLAVALDVGLADVVQKTTTTTHELEQTTTRVVVLLVRLEVRREVDDPLGQQCNLHFGRSRVAVGGAELFDDFGFAVGLKSHCRAPMTGAISRHSEIAC